MELSDEEFKARMKEIEYKLKSDDLAFRSRMKELERSRQATELALKIHEANINCENGVDKSGFRVLDNNLGITSMGRKVLRLRGGASQGSDCDSDGVPGYMQGGYDDGDDMDLVYARREVEDFPLLVVNGGEDKDFYEAEDAGTISKKVDPELHMDENGVLSPNSAKIWVESEKKVREAKGVFTQPSSLVGGIPVETVTVEDYVSSDEEVPHETALEAMEHQAVNRAAKFAFSVNKQERDELFQLRKKMHSLQAALEKRGVSLAELEREQIEGENGFNMGLTDLSGIANNRDEFGLPILKGSSKIVDKEGVSGAKDHDGREISSGEAEKLLDGDDFPELPKAATISQHPRSDKVKVSPKSWSSVLKSAPTNVSDVTFDFCPLPKGETIVTPPDDVLQKGLDKFKNCLVGVFTKETLSFNAVNDIAFKVWGKRGLQKVFQKSVNTFIFKFSRLMEKNFILSRGTWKFNGKPVVFRDWNAGEVKSIPIWVKFHNIPDCYWTREGLSHIVSVVGNPIYADSLTSQLEVLPFARFCVDYVVGADLPALIPVSVVDSFGNKSVVDVKVEYAQKPLFCTGCKALGHLVSVCPSVQRIWVQKNRSSYVQSPTSAATCTEEPPSGEVDAENNVVNDVVNDLNDAKPEANTVVEGQNEEPWVEVTHKRSFSSRSCSSGSSPVPSGCISPPLEPVLKTCNPGASAIDPVVSSPNNDSPALPTAFRNVLVDEIDRNLGALPARNLEKLSKSQRKKQKKALKAASPHPL